ncbi:RluA family pseudouridine synthase [Paenibacillus psychroresistens]|uniref:Pseudouridine synthase n=1 Tax=Paenibacillus psychroresistens TaxID=1778678 RepID=A0A6B8RII8_9BACL|nr:RluA family pseudouridine synthase [Paenibacillus psychroresistens]QGQ95382.1 RluA family pseudouridine synthase [Paenibacillus psychroresistens]
MRESSVRRGEWLEIPLRLEAEQSLDEWLLAVGGIPQKLIDKLRQAHGIRQKTDRIMLNLFPEENDEYQAHWMDIEIVYEDDFCLVVNKPAGLKVHSSVVGEISLGNAVAAHYLHSGQACKIRHIHRLDEFTSGAVLYAKNELAQLKLDEFMRAKLIHRQYVAFVQGKVKASKGRIDEPIGRDRHHPSRRRVSATGDQAVTHYERIAAYGQATLLRLRLETGRTHQIRVHLSHIQHPILGDKLYGGDLKAINRQALHGELLQFPHPFYNRLVEVEAAWPPDLSELQAKLQ